MVTENQFEVIDAEISELKDNMLIKAYTGFGEKYCPMDDSTCKWIVHNFKGAKAQVQREGENLSTQIEDLKAGDTLLEITSLPSTLLNIMQVNRRLIKELEERGFKKFRVQPAPPAERAVVSDDGESRELANHFVQKVKESIDLCSNATQAVENLLDSARQGKTDTKDIESFVGDIAENQSSDAISAIISLKENDQVYAHCVDVAVVYQTTYFEIKKLRGETPLFADEKEAMLAAFLHDIGKAKVPKEILNSTAPFKRNSPEMELIRTHTDTGAEMLRSMGMPEHFINMAHYHHVKTDPTMASSYPKNVEQDEIIFETKLLALVDAYQALTAGRSYKKSWTPPAVIRYLDATAGVEFDLQLWQDFQTVMGHYPRGSFVKLSDGSHGFVLTVPRKDVLRPQVAVIRDADDKDLSSHYLVDLEAERDLSIVKDIDVKSIYKENALDVFSSINIH